MEIVPGGVEEQTKQALKNLKSVVEASGSEVGKIAKVTVSHLSCSLMYCLYEGTLMSVCIAQ
jgi:enamine deaminase RidA (YjgF/YER057c/UK114 family)